MDKKRYKLIGRWGSRTKTHAGESLDTLRALALNWSRAGAACSISTASGDLIEAHHADPEPTR